MKKESGAIGLMVVAALLIATLAMTMSSYRSVYFQIKKAQNEVQYRQEQWLAEGGLECAYAQMKSAGSVVSNPNNCSLSPSLSVTIGSSGGGYEITSSVASSHVKKTVASGGSMASGAMQTSADIYFNSSLAFGTPDPGELTGSGWECVALRYKSRFHAASIINQGVIHGHKPWDSFSSSVDCVSDTDPTKNHMSSGDGQDFIEDSTLKPFESFFGVAAVDHDTVRDSGEFFIINGTGTPKKVADCGTVVKNAINAGHELLWIEGGCEFKSAETIAVVNAAQDKEGTLILVHDGIFSVMGASSTAFKGILFQFNHGYIPDPSHWSGYDASTYLHHVPSVISDATYRDIAAYYQHGAITFSGGQYFDMTDQAAIFYESLNFSYNRDVISYITSNFQQLQWVKGSWHDF